MQSGSKSQSFSNMTPSAAPFLIKSEVGVTLIYDDPTITVYLSKVSFAGICKYMFLYCLLQALNIAIICHIFDVNHALIAALFYIPCLLATPFVSFKLSRVRFVEKSPRIGSQVSLLFAFIFFLTWLLFLSSTSPSGWAILIVFLLSLGGGLAIGQFDIEKAVKDAAKEIKTLPRAVVKLSELQERRLQLRTKFDNLSNLPLFSENDPTLVSAWKSKSVSKIQRSLKDGADLNDKAEQRAVDFFNEAAKQLDIYRSRLKQLIFEGREVLISRNFELIDIGERSSVASLEFRPINLSISQVNTPISSAATGRMIGRVAQQNLGAAAWMGGIVIATAAIADMINKSKNLRELKDLEGKLLIRTEEAKANIITIKNQISLWIFERLDRSIKIIERLESELSDIETGSISKTSQLNQKNANLARIVKEAELLLSLKAED